MEGKRTMPRDIKHGQSGKYILNVTRLSKDLCVYQRNTTWYIRINKQPTWRDKFSCSLKTCDKEGNVIPQEEDHATCHFAKSARIFKNVRDMVAKNEIYVKMRKDWRSSE